MGPVRLAELCASTSLFTDLGTGQPVDHGLRATLISMRLAAALGAGGDTSREVLYTSLLRFLGCTAESYTLAELGGGDERRVLAGMAPVTMGSSLEEVGRLLSVAGADESLLRRARLLLSTLLDPGSSGRLLQAHCEVASRLARDIGLPSGVAGALAYAYARWDGRGVPGHVGGARIPEAMRIAVVARDIELWARETDDGRTVRVLRERRAAAYDPDVVDAALDIGIEELRRCEGDLWDTVVSLEPPPVATVSGGEIDRVLDALGDFADLKHPSLTGHSRRVARTVSNASELRGLAADEALEARRAAVVHDVGMVAVPVSALSGATTTTDPVAAEQVRMHPIWGQRLLARCHGLRSIADIVGRHHERLDGSGYPTGRRGALDPPSGLLACAVYWHERVGTGEEVDEATRRAAADELTGSAKAGAFDRADVAAVVEAAGVRAPLVDHTWPAGLTDREVEVLRSLARGQTNRAIAAELGIAPRTVGAHLEHIYDKLDVESRAAATLFAAQHGLVT